MLPGRTDPSSGLLDDCLSKSNTFLNSSEGGKESQEKFSKSESEGRKAIMAPKTRSGKEVGTVVTKKVVEETVEVVVSPGEKDNSENEDEGMEVVSESIKANEKFEVIISSSAKRPVKVVVVGGKAEEEDQQPRQEKPDDKSPEQLQQEKEQQQNQEDEQPEQREEYLQDQEQGQQQRQEQEQAEQKPDQGKEQRQDEEEELQEESEAEDEETQQTSQPEVTPATTPPKYEAPPRKEEEENSKKRKKEDENAAKESQKKNTTRKGGGEESGKRRKKRAKVGGGGGQEYKRYVFRVMKQVHPDMGISSKAMTVINNLMSDMFERFADEASKLSRYVGRATLSSMEIQDAVKLVLPGDIGKHAIAEGSKAVTNYVANVTGDSKFKIKSKS